MHTKIDEYPIFLNSSFSRDGVNWVLIGSYIWQSIMDKVNDSQLYGTSFSYKLKPKTEHIRTDLTRLTPMNRTNAAGISKYIQLCT